MKPAKPLVALVNEVLRDKSLKRGAHLHLV